MNDTPQNERTWSDALGLVLVAAGAFASMLLVLAVTDYPVTGQTNSVKAMGHALLWAGGLVPTSIMSLACLLLGASQFLGYQEARRVTRHLFGVLGVSVGLCVVLGAFSGSAGGRLGVVMGGGLAELAYAPLAALVGLGAICCVAWVAWLSPSRATAWEMAQEIEKPAVPLRVKADGVSSEESAALAYEGEPEIPTEALESPYPEDVRVLGEIPEGAAALGAEETSNHDENTEEPGGDEQDEIAPSWSQTEPGAESEGDALMLASEQGDEEPAGEDLVIGEESSALDTATAAEVEDELTAAEAGEELADAYEEAGEEGSVETQGGSDLDQEEELEDDDSDYEEAEGVEGKEVEEEYEEGEEEYEEEGEIEEEGQQDAPEHEEEEAAEVDEVAGSEASWEGQGHLFEMVEEEEVILEPQAKPSGHHEEVLMKAADLFLDRDRVAVSLLQRQFNLDFEESCAVLDELQEMGLIGPYLGGNRRDILLTRDEWLERSGGAS